MNSDNLFSQAKLDELLGVDYINPPQSQDPTDVRHHPSLSQEKDTSNHKALTNRYNDLSRLGGPAEIPGTTPPQETEVKSMKQIADQSMKASRMEELPSGSSDNMMMPDMELSTSEQMVMGFMNQILANSPISNAFCDQLVQMLCNNVQFMTKLRSQLIEELTKNPSIL